MTRFDGFGAVITTSVHEVADCGQEGRSPDGLTPAEAWLTCVCGWEWDSMESAGGPVGSMRDAWEIHLESVSEDPEIGGETIE